MKRAVVLVNIEPQRTETVFNSVSKMRGVKEAIQVYGEYDAAFVIAAEHTLGVQEFVRAVRKMKGIARTVTLIEL